ncbi:MAG TPA: class I SAM-dependent methyltransferase [Acidimicrobiales bacterium]|nr:class I SAM-dependent methyltransferase [Acidimicrobiales bacterium]
MNKFDEKAATWDDDPAHVERAAVVAGAIRDAVPLDSSVRLLEYGAGTGLVSQALRDSAGPITLVDTSAGMRKVMADKVAAGLIADARVWDLDLAAAPLPASEERFDLIVTVLALHHLPQMEPVLSNFATLLAEGGHLAIVDLDEEDGTFHGDGFDGHHGFDHDALADDLGRAGFTNVSFQRCHQIVRDGRDYPLFLATATRT